MNITSTPETLFILTCHMTHYWKAENQWNKFRTNPFMALDFQFPLHHNVATLQHRLISVLLFLSCIQSTVKPESTTLSSKPKQLISDQEYSLSCDVKGSVPDTEIRWMQNNRLYTKGKVGAHKLSISSSPVSSLWPSNTFVRDLFLYRQSNVPFQPRQSNHNSLISALLILTTIVCWNLYQFTDWDTHQQLSSDLGAYLSTQAGRRWNYP